MATHQRHQSNPAPEAAQKQSPAKPAPVQSGPTASTELSSPLDLQRAIADPRAASPRDILTLQRLAGNRAVARLIQAKLTVGPAGDKYEQEADRVAEQVVSGQPSAISHQRSAISNQTPNVKRQGEEEEVQTKPLAASITPLVQRQEDEDEIQTFPSPGGRGARGEGEIQRQEDEDELQFKPNLQPSTFNPLASFEAGPDVESRLAADKGGGSPLPGDVRATLEPRFGADFGEVRIHTGGEADRLNRQLSAQAFTHGQDIYMSAGKYAPGTPGGNRLLAHELTHTIQQQAVPKTQRAGQPVQLKPAATIQRGIGDWFKKKFGKGGAAEAPVANLWLCVDKADDGAVGHSWIALRYAPNAPTDDQLNQLSLLDRSKRELKQEYTVQIGFWPLHTMRFNSAAEERLKTREFTHDIWAGKTPGGGRTLEHGRTGFSTNILKAFVPGRVEEPDEVHNIILANEKRLYHVTQAQLKNASAYINSKRNAMYSAYGVGGENCTSFAVNVVKAAGQSAPDSKRLGVSTPDLLATGIAKRNAKDQPAPRPAAVPVAVPPVVAAPMTIDQARQGAKTGGLSDADIAKLEVEHKSLQNIVDESFASHIIKDDLQNRFNTPQRLEALALLMGISADDVEQQIGALH